MEKELYLKKDYWGDKIPGFKSLDGEVSIYIHKNEYVGSFPGYMNIKLIHSVNFSPFNNHYTIMREKYEGKDCVLINDKEIFMFGLFNFKKIINEGKHKDHYRYDPDVSLSCKFIENAIIKSNVFPDKKTLYYELRWQYKKWFDFKPTNDAEIIQPKMFDDKTEIKRVYE